MQIIMNSYRMNSRQPYMHIDSYEFIDPRTFIQIFCMYSYGMNVLCAISYYGLCTRMLSSRVCMNSYTNMSFGFCDFIRMFYYLYEFTNKYKTNT